MLGRFEANLSFSVSLLLFAGKIVTSKYSGRGFASLPCRENAGSVQKQEPISARHGRGY